VFEPCRYDGLKIPSLTVEHLWSYADGMPLCPEVETGRGISLEEVK